MKKPTRKEVPPPEVNGEEWRADITPEFLHSKLLSAISEILTTPKPGGVAAALNKNKPTPEEDEFLFREGMSVRPTGLDTELTLQLKRIWESRVHRQRVAAEGWQVSTKNGEAVAAHKAAELSILMLQALASWEPEVFERIGVIMRQLSEKNAVPRWGAVAREVLDAMKKPGVPELTKSELAYLTRKRMVDLVGYEVVEPVWPRVWEDAGCKDLKSGKPGPQKGSGGRPRKGRVSHG